MSVGASVVSTMGVNAADMNAYGCAGTTRTGVTGGDITGSNDGTGGSNISG